MGLVSKNLKICGVKISAFISGVPSFGSGVVYETPNYCDYNYVLTAKHILQEDSQTEFDTEKVSNLTIYYNDNGSLKRLQSIRKNDLDSKLILFKEDFAIIIIEKNPNVIFRQILVSDDLNEEDEKFFAWATFSANEQELHLFNFERNDDELKRVKLIGSPSPESLPGMSGAGLFIEDKNVLHGIICRYPNENFELNTIDCTQLSFKQINSKLSSINKVELDTKSSNHKKEINNSVVDIHQAIINDVSLNLELARLRLKTDIVDDWFQDPLKYIDLLNQNYLFEQFSEYFDVKNYKASQAEQFYVPKKQFTLRQALISPFIDRIMYMATVGVLAEKMDNAMIPSVYSARFNKFSKNQLIINGVEQWKKLQYALADKANEVNEEGNFKYNCLIEIDLLNFYDNINKRLLIEKVERICETNNEKKACKLLSEIIFNFSNKDSGLPQNSDASSLLAAFYLNQVDVYMQNSSLAYFRFMDDIRIFCNNKYEARRILQDFEYELRRCYLSVNSQKTKIISILDSEEKNEVNSIYRGDFSKLFDLELNKISRLRKSSNYAYLNEAFHQSVELLKNNIEEDPNSSEISSKRLNYALNTIELLGKKNINLYNLNSEFKNALQSAINSLYDKPWMTSQVCKVLNLIPTEIIREDYLNQLKSIIVNKNYNTYAFQTYQIWLLLAKHKVESDELIQYAVSHIEKNDETNRANIAAMIIYVCSVDLNYQRVIIRKFGEGFTHGYFQNRTALISLRKFDTKLISREKTDKSLKNSHKHTNIHKSRDLVYIKGFDEQDSEDDFIEQLYSI